MAPTTKVLRAIMSSDLRAAIFGRLDPAIFDAIFPHGPVLGVADDRRDRVALNPQPLPPREVAVGMELMQRITVAAIARGRGLGDGLLEEVEDWCGTGWPKWWPKPWPQPGPPPDPWRRSEVFLGAMLAAADLAARYDDPEAVAVLDKAADLLADAAVG